MIEQKQPNKALEKNKLRSETPLAIILGCIFIAMAILSSSSSFEVVGTYLVGASPNATVNVFDVGGHFPILINQNAHRETNLTSTLSVTAAQGTNLITVVDASVFTVGDLLEIKDGEIFSNSYLEINNITGNNIKLKVPIGASLPIGTTITKVYVNIATDPIIATASLDNPVIYELHPPIGSNWHITRLIITALDDKTPDDSKFLGETALTNGIILRTNRSGILFNLGHFKNNYDFRQVSYDLLYSEKGGGGLHGMSMRWTFAKAEATLDLDNITDSIQILIQDPELADINNMEWQFQGHRFDID